MLILSAWHRDVAAQAATRPPIPVFMQEMMHAKGQIAKMTRIENFLDFVAISENLQLQPVFYPWRRAINKAENGEGLIFGIARNKQNEKNFHFSLPVHSRYIFLVTRADMQFPFHDWNDLKGKSIGVPRGAQFNEAFEAHQDKLFRLEQDSPEPLSRIYKLLFKRMDAAVFASPVKNPKMLENRLQILREENKAGLPQIDDVELAVLPNPIMTVNLHFAIRSDKDDGVIEQLNNAILRARKAGILEDIR
ncbi:substrate-binding periplasmic protein [Undibacterium rugosum]|uniref:Transporter substrate-binding domain-containing protein n=1 Tax=Undibacterium rugosum TaxID=2762291 RepID=A0A923IC62_9BURK|nr:transporter substrate-binding domain-containing protein [Undibacterium rugosum]MBC3936675.1 transporter substrate-binding domain-containing protein [Undibacterium rugosum]MBR7777973.1 transporter substrate-binding domain-containing protein [Undibacterium rugosum]